MSSSSSTHWIFPVDIVISFQAFTSHIEDFLNHPERRNVVLEQLLSPELLVTYTFTVPFHSNGYMATLFNPARYARLCLYETWKSKKPFSSTMISPEAQGGNGQSRPRVQEHPSGSID